MILREMLKNYKGQIIKIGAKNGSSWMYCDRCTDRTFEILELMSEKMVKELTATIKRKQKILRSLNTTRTEKIVAKRVIEDCEQQLNEYKALLDREVVETYATVDCSSIHEPMIDIRAIIVEGREVGKFWTLSEYANYGIH
jgi:glycyl-tRNA synthetase beta subunit